MENETNFTVPVLGPCKVQSPVKMSKIHGDKLANYVADDEFILFDLNARPKDPRREYNKEELLEKAGPREMVYFNPSHVHAAIVTCGGLCPGLNDVIRAIVHCLWYRYGIKRITGIRYGYRGFLSEYNIPTMELNPEIVKSIHNQGGTILGSSRGGGDVPAIADAIERMNINILFTIGGDGTLNGALAIARELETRNTKVAVIGIPKTIDNDISFVERSFGFETAVTKAVEAIHSAHVEANDSVHGIGLVKVMGRDAGFIAASTSLATSDVNFCLIPEFQFDLEGPNGLFVHLEKRLLARNHAVILAAEGAGQDLMNPTGQADESGNKKLGDIGAYLKTEISQYFKKRNIEVNMKYIDPSYMIRSAPAFPTDSIYCARLGTNAVHAAMAGRTKVLISLVNNVLVHLPIEIAVSRKNSVDIEGSLWRDVLETTGQPVVMKN
ncbi:MAG: ATP-dependent 6-phosphofructokinase [Spirochaetales bacterium]|nr:MAG: ATP-dependent 6-phosphofructokinase [Spirochaetales bacterium]